MPRIIILVVFTLLSFSKTDTEIFGNYAAQKPGLGEQITMLVTGMGRIAGCEMELNSDSTFHYTTCANYFSGTWKIKLDSLYLFQESNILRKDSTELILPPYAPNGIIRQPIVFALHHNHIVQELQKMNGKKSLNILVKRN